MKDRSEILRLYNEGLSKTEIAKLVGENRQYVHSVIGNRSLDIMREILTLGVDYPVPTNSVKVLQVLKMFNEGLSVGEIAPKARLTETRVRDITRIYYTEESRKMIRRRTMNTKTSQAIQLRQQGKGVVEIGEILGITPQAAWTMSARRDIGYKPTMTRDEMRLHHEWMTTWLDENGIEFDNLRVHRHDQYTIWIRNEKSMQKALAIIPREDHVYAGDIILRVKAWFV